MLFTVATTPDEREAVNAFLDEHNPRGRGSTRGYVAYYAATSAADGQIVAAAKLCPLHTPQSARFFAGEDWRHVYCLQRLAAQGVAANVLSRFLAWCLRQIGHDPRVWYVATFADSATFDTRYNRPHNGGIYRATNAVYCGLTRSSRVEAYVLDGQRHSVRRGPKTLRLSEIPAEAALIRGTDKHRYCWAVGAPLQRRFRLRALQQRMAQYHFVPAYQPRLLIRILRRLRIFTLCEVVCEVLK